MQIIHTCLVVSDVNRSVDFYRLLGFETWVSGPFRDTGHVAFMGLPGDGPRLELKSVKSGGPGSTATGYGHLGVVIDDLSGTLAALSDAGFEPDEAPFTIPEVPGTVLCFIRDPDGYQIELWSPNGPELPPPA